MKPALANYAKLKICVAVSGGKDSMALLHYLHAHANEYGIILSALNCDHSMRGEASVRDSLFVASWCEQNSIPLMRFVRGEAEVGEAAARRWRLDCYREALQNGADAVATAHHLNDNAETVLFNLARGGGLSAMTGITDTKFYGGRLIRPLISCTRAEIEEYIIQNNVPYVEDETNFTDVYTRNKIRLTIMPELEKAVPGAAEAIHRFSRLAAEDDGFINSVMRERGILETDCGTAFIKTCVEKPLFARAAVSAVKDFFRKKDYTLSHIEALYNLQFAETGKRFEFLGLCAYKEKNRITLSAAYKTDFKPVAFKDFKTANLCGVRVEISDVSENGCLKFDAECIPETAVVRTFETGDKFKKFGGGTKRLGDFLTDRKIPVRLRKTIPLIADGDEVLAVCGIEISDKIKVTENTRKVRYIICRMNK